MSKKWIFSFVLLLVIFTSKAQFRKIPAEVTDSFKEKYENASAVSWKDKLTSFEADFKQGDKEMKAFFSSRGELIKTETKYSIESLPLSVRDGFKKSKFADLNVLDAALIDENDKEPHYRIIVKKNDINNRSLVFSKDGQLISDYISF